MTATTVRKRVQLEVGVGITSGGRIRGEGFRLAVDGEDIDDAALVDHLVRGMRLPAAVDRSC